MTGAAAALPAWCGFMNEAVKVYGKEEFAAPDGVKMIRTCSTSGLLATPQCPRSISDACEPGREPAAYCTTHAGTTPIPAEEAPEEDEAPAPGE